MKFTDHDREMLEIFSDPVKWATYHLGEKPRWYQEEILRHPHNRKVLRCGRRVGKCIEASQRILDPNTGLYRSVDELYQKYKGQMGTDAPLVTLGDNWQQEKSSAFFIEDNGTKPVFAVQTKKGNEVVLTDNHPVLTIDGWKEVKDLEIGEQIATPLSLPYFGSKSIGEDKVLFYAYVMATGFANDHRLHVTIKGKGQVLIDDFNQSAHRLGIHTAELRERQSTYLVRVSASQREELANWIYSKHLPDFVFTLPKEELKLFLQTYISSKSYIYMNSKSAEIGVSSIHKSLLLDIKHCLLRFGVPCVVMKNHDGYLLKIKGKQYLSLFLSEIGIKGQDEKIKALLAHLQTLGSAHLTIPKEAWAYIDKECKEKGMTTKAMAGGGRPNKKRNFNREDAALWAENLHSSFLYDLAHSDIDWQEVTAIDPQGESQTYNVSVPKTYNLVVEDIYVHNTWTMCAHMLWVAFTCMGGTRPKGATCIVATPYENQVEVIFDQLKKFINTNDALKSSVTSITKKPYRILFKNGSAIKLFTAGTKSGNEGGSLRGQAADYLYMDRIIA